MKKFGKKYKQDGLDRKYRINDRIRIKTVRAIGPDGEQLGIIPTVEAMQKAKQYGLDLVEVSANSRPPVCKILDFGKMRYEHGKKEKEKKKKSHKQTVKTVRLSPGIGEGDLTRKIGDVQKFIDKGFRVNITCQLKGRWRQHQDVAIAQIQRVKDEVTDATSEKINRQGSTISTSLIANPQTTQ